MPAVERVEIEPEVLRWARETAGYTPSMAAKRLGVKSEMIDQWESGELSPTISQLRRVVALYDRPLAVLLLPAVPVEGGAPVDFRARGAEGEKRWTPELHAELKRAISQRQVFLELREVSPESLPSVADRVQVGQQDPEGAARIIRSALGIDGWPRTAWHEPRTLLSMTIQAAERLGILVIQTEGVDPSEMQGFSVAKWPYPVIALNGGDPSRRRLFTLVHELCHVARGASGVCDLHENPPGNRDQRDEAEAYCNAVAAAVFMPREIVMADPTVSEAARMHAWTLTELSHLSDQFGLSSEAVLIRLIDLGEATWSTYELRKPELDSEYARWRRETKERQRGREGGPNYYVVKVRNLGKGYAAAVLDAYYNRAISSRDVANYLNIRFDQLHRLEQWVS